MLRDIRTGSIDLATLALWPYVVGFLVAISYYSRFRIFSVSLLSAQYIIVGLYVLFLYGVIPFVLLRLCSSLPERGQLIVAVLTLAFVDWVMVYLLNMVSSLPLSFVSAIHLLLVQLLCFVSNPLRPIDLSRSPSSLRLLTLFLLVSLHFAYTFFGSIPYYLGGGEPVEVFVFPSQASESSLQSMFARDYFPELGSKRKVFKLKLLFESEKDFFFIKRRVAKFEINERRSSSGTAAITVMRIPKNIIERMEYYSPQWLLVPRGVK